MDVSGQRGDKRAATMFAIERAALPLFVERGFDVVTAEQIAEAAGVSVRTFFRYFPEGKEGVVLLETRRGIDLLEDALRRRPANEPAVEAMRQAVLESARMLDEPSDPDESYGLGEAMKLYGQIVTEHPHLLARLMGERVLLMERLVGLVALRMSIDPSTDVRPRYLLHAADAAVRVAWFAAFADPDLDHGALLNTAFDLLEQGLATAVPSGVAGLGRAVEAP